MFKIGGDSRDKGRAQSPRDINSRPAPERATVAPLRKFRERVMSAAKLSFSPASAVSSLPQQDPQGRRLNARPPPLTTWLIMLRRLGEQKRQQARLQAKRELPQTGDPILVTEDDGTKVHAIIVRSPRYDPPRTSVLGRYTVNVDEV